MANVTKGGAVNSRKANSAGNQPKRSISSKLLIILIPMISAAILFIILFLSLQANGIIVELANDSLKHETIANSNGFSKDISTFVGKLDTLAITLEQFDFESNEELLDFLTRESTKLSDSAPNGIYLALDDGSWIDPSGWMPDADYVAADRPWYQDGIKHDSFTLGKPYMDAVTNSMVVPVARKITLSDGRSGVAATDMSIAKITDTVSTLTPMDTGRTMLLDGESILSYYEEEYNGSMVNEHSDDAFLASIYARIDNTSEPQEIKAADGTVYITDFESIEGTTWTLISTVAKKDVLRDLNRFKVVCWILAAVTIVAIALVMLKLISSIVTKPVKKLTDNIISITNSDFTVQISESGNDEIGLMNSNMKKFIMHMRASLGQMRDETM